MEEIFGDIQDEHDVPEEVEKKLGENEFLLSGRLEIDYLNQQYGLDLPEHEAYETLGGFILHHHENVPEPGEEVIIPPYTITAVKVKSTRIEQVKLVIDRES